ncbi:MAG: hypothetical protein HQK50_14200 [Oligoflexia bacterium]|nr:hypothetical protein [Oligoflexia bacterium]
MIRKIFALLPSNLESAYRPLIVGTNLNEIFCMIEERSVHCGNRIFIDNQIFVITSPLSYSVVNKTVEIKTYRNGVRKYFIDDSEVQVEQLITTPKAA